VEASEASEVRSVSIKQGRLDNNNCHKNVVERLLLLLATWFNAINDIVILEKLKMLNIDTYLKLKLTHRLCNKT